MNPFGRMRRIGMSAAHYCVAKSLGGVSDGVGLVRGVLAFFAVEHKSGKRADKGVTAAADRDRRGIVFGEIFS